MTTSAETYQDRGDADVLRAYCDGDQKAFDCLAERHRTSIFRMCCGFLPGRSRASAEDATQLVLCVMARKAHELVNHPSLTGWLHRTAWYVTRNINRTESGPVVATSEIESLSDRQSTDSSGDEMGLLGETQAVLHELIAEMPEGQRIAITEHYFAGKSYERIANERKCAKGTVQVQIRRGQEHLRRGLKRRGIAISLTAVVAGLEGILAQGAEADPLGGDVSGCQFDEPTQRAADAIVREMDRSAMAAAGWKIGVTAAALVGIATGWLLVANHCRTTQTVAVPWRIESVTGSVQIRSLQAPLEPKPGAVLRRGDTILTASEQEVSMVSDAGDRVVMREDGELAFGAPVLATPGSDRNAIPGSTSPDQTFFSLGKGALVVQARRPTRLSTSYAEFDSAGADFFLMIAETTNGFVRLDVTDGSVTCLRPPVGISASGDKLEGGERQVLVVPSGQAVCIGTNASAQTMPSDRREFSAKYGGVFFREFAELYTKTGFALSALSFSPGPSLLELSPEQMKERIASSNMNVRCIAEDERDVVAVANPDPIRRIASWRYEGKGVSGVELEFDFRLYSGALAFGDGGSRCAPFVPSPLPPKALPAADQGEDPPFGAWIRLRERDLLVGRTPDGASIYEKKLTYNGAPRTVMWVRTEFDMFVVFLRGAEVRFRGLSVRELLTTR